MLSEQCTGGFCPAGLKTRSGQLWFPTLKGVVMVQPQLRQTTAPPPPVVLEEVMVDGMPLRNWAGTSPGGDKPGEPARAQAGLTAQGGSGLPTANSSANITLSPGRHQLEFHYAGLSFSTPDRVRFRYQMEGLEPDWVEAGTRRTAYYGYVPPGFYRFKVTARNGDGVWNEAGASLGVTVLPRFWQTWWFLGLLALGILGSVAGAARIVEKRKLDHRLAGLEAERTLERERARIAQDLHDDLGASLTRISLLSDLVKADKEVPAQVETHANKIAQSARQTVRALDEIVWALRPGSDSVQSLVEYIAHFATELFEGDRARCRLDLPADVPRRFLLPEVRHNIFLIIKEALTNALRHAQAHEVRVQVKTEMDSLEIVVQDDGRGFEPQAPLRPGKHEGLGNMRRRAEAMGGSLAVDSAAGAGTAVRLVVRFP
jgi:signal transduction histidine kinase